MRIAARRSCNDVELETMTTEQTPTLTVLHAGTPIFTSHGKWLHPLFELEDYLAAHAFQPDNLILQDKIIGKAAALLILRMGFHTVKAGVLSRLGEAVLQRHGIVYTYEQLVDRIHCQTEELLATVEDPEEAYQLVKVRAGR
jgi:Domain of unknown function (DUF1893)